MAASIPDPVLVDAAAMVFVSHPTTPELADHDAHHLLDVLRLRPGESVVAGDGHGTWVPGRISPSVAGRSGRQVDPGAVLEVDGDPVFVPRGEPSVTVGFAPTKGDRPEWVVQKLTELGVDRIVPLRTDRSVVVWDGPRADKALTRLRRTALEASAQCRRAHWPDVTEVLTLSGLAEVAGGEPVLAVPGGGPLTTGMSVVAIGPEGGWSDEELAAPGARPGLGLGATVLRAETAALVAGHLMVGLRGGQFLPLA